MKCTSRNVPNITGEYYNKNSDGLLYSEIQVFMILGIQQSVPFAVNTCPEIQTKLKQFHFYFLLLRAGH